MKKVATTLKALPTTEVYERIIDTKDPVDDIIEDLRDHWAYDIDKRSPSSALLADGAMVRTDLDLVCLIASLADRGAVINLPTYERRRQAHVRENETIVSANNRHGTVIGVTSNKDVFSFSVLIKDMNVVVHHEGKPDEVGAFRNFMLVDLDGKWHEGWRTIELVLSKKENAALLKNFSSNKIVFEHFIHPNRWVSFYGQWYVFTKILIARLREEAKDLTVQIRDAMDGGIKLPAEDSDGTAWAPSHEVGDYGQEMVKSFEAEIDAPIPTNFPLIVKTPEGVIAARKRRNKIRHYDIPALSFAVRATELAFCNQARSFNALVCDTAGDGTSYDVKARSEIPLEPFPSWISGAAFEATKVKRTVWNRLVLGQRFPFEKGLAIRYRVKWKTEKVAG